MYKKRRRSNVVEKFKEVSDSVWVSFEAVIIENTLKEESSQNNHYNDNYNYYSAQFTTFSNFVFNLPIELTAEIRYW